MEEKKVFIKRLLSGEECMSHLCKEYGISRKTGYKFYDRYLEMELEGLVDLRCGAKNQANRTSEIMEKLILKLRKKHPSWGPKKLKAKLSIDEDGVKIPAASTIGKILVRQGVELKARSRRKRRATPTIELTQSVAANDIYCIDFKGQFRLGNGKYCYPLTVTDHFSRFILCCEALENTSWKPVQKIMEGLFRKYGLPKVIRSDNGSPFASVGLMGLSQLSVWFTSLGIRCERIEPGKPEQNGRHERMHLTLKEETTRPASQNILAQQERFDRFVQVFNFQRPHEALEQKIPKDVYRFSERKFSDHSAEFDYALDDMQRRVNQGGFVRFETSTSFYLSLAFSDYRVGLREIKLGIWCVRFRDMVLGFYHARRHKFFRSLEELQLDDRHRLEKKGELLGESNQLPFDYEICSNF
jgi:putative transposase